jgi:hypothetical protein
LPNDTIQTNENVTTTSKHSDSYSQATTSHSNDTEKKDKINANNNDIAK